MAIPDPNYRYVELDAKTIVLTKEQFDNIHNQYQSQIAELEKTNNKLKEPIPNEIRCLKELKRIKELETPPWAKDTQKNIKEHGSYADFVAWENWLKELNDYAYDILDNIDITETAHLYSMFCDCFPNYTWE